MSEPRHGTGARPGRLHTADIASAPHFVVSFSNSARSFGSLLGSLLSCTVLPAGVRPWAVANIGALPLAVAQDMGCRVAYLPGLSMRRAADLYPGEAKTDARDAYVIADTARSMPHTLRDVEVTDEKTAELAMLVGYDDDLAGEATPVSNRLRGLLTQIHPSLERVLGPRIHHPAVLALLERFGSPARIRKAGRSQLITLLEPLAPRMHERLVGDIFDALDEQTVVVPGTEAAAVIVPSLARQLAAVLDQRRLLETQISTLLEALPLSKLLMSLPGVGIRTGATLLGTIGDGTTFATAGHLASYAGLAPVTKASGTSIRGEHAPHRGNRQLKRAMFLSAFAALHEPASRAYYDKQRATGKTHTQALLRLARRRTDVIHAMLRNGTFYEPRTPKNPAEDIDHAA
ncbi:IS110 family transposase [Streptomyces sp. NPDC058612]|uniref:IS110 family transposase n=1 Tax=Streptomyces sp. NPDC058612 TaxID=3346555 RepID=UPI003665820D